MKYLVLSIVGFWFAFLSVMQSLHGWERFIVANHYSPIALLYAFGCVLLVGFGYAVFFITLINYPLERMKTITLTLFCALATIGIFACAAIFMHPGIVAFFRIYKTLDMFMRTQYDITIAWMDFANTLLLFATCIWWGLTGIILLLLPQTRRRNV